jgi:hypothetical protein
MANVKISDLIDAGSIAGTEVLEIVQSGNSRKVTAANLRSGPRVWYVDTAGTDGGLGTYDAPLETLSHAVSRAVEGDIIRCGPGLIVREEIDFTAKKLTIEGTPGAPITIINIDDFAGTWTLAGAANRYTATISHDWGGAGVKNAASQYAPSLFQNGIRLQEVRAESGSEAFQFASEAAALAYVEANEGTFYVAGLNGSEYSAGWEQGNQVYHVHRFGGGNPNSDTWSVAQRTGINFKTGSTIRNLDIVGCVYSVAIQGYDCLYENVRIFFPGMHGFILGGSTAIDCAVYGGNKSMIGYHAFHGISNAYRELTYLKRPTVIDFKGPSCSAIGCHGVVDEVEILGLYEIDDLFCENVAEVINNGEETGAVILRRCRARNCDAIGYMSCDVRFDGPEISCNNQSGVNTGLTRVPKAGKTLSFYGPGFISGENFPLYSTTPNLGAFYAQEMSFMFSNNGSTRLWCNATAQSDGFEFVRCAFRAEGRLAGAQLFTSEVNVLTPFTMTDCILDGCLPPSHATLTRTFTGDARIRKDGVGIHTLINAPLPDTGETLIDVAAPTAAFASITSFVAVTDKRIWTLGDQAGNGGVPVPVDLADGEVANGVVFCGTKVVVYGDDGLVYVSASGSGDSFAAVTSGLSTNFVGAVSALDGKAYLLGDAGEIYLYDPAGPTFTAKTSGVTYPLKGGYYDGSEFVVVGGNGSSDGGILNSTDGNTWTEVYSSTSSEYLIDATKINSVWVAVTSRSSLLLTSSDGASWTRYQGFDFAIGWHCAPNGLVADTQNNQLWLYGAHDYDGGPNGREPKIIVFNVSGTNPTTWTRREVHTTLPAITVGARNPNRAAGGTQNGAFFIFGGPFLRFSNTVDGYDWQSWAPRRFSEPPEGVGVWSKQVLKILART